MTSLRDWFTPSYVSEFRFTLTRLERALTGLRREVFTQGETMSAETDALKAGQTRLFGEIDRMAHELREIADKLNNNPNDAATIIEVTGALNAKADALNALTTEVDTDGSSPAPTA